MLVITHPTIARRGSRTRLIAEIVKDGVAHPLWFEVEEQFADGLCDDRCDAFVVGLLNYAMQFGHDIVCEGPLTNELHFKLTTQLIDVLSRYNPLSRKDGIYPVSITAPLVPPLDLPKPAVGAGLSCGVDSLHVFAKYTASRWPEKNITHACVFNLHGLTKSDTPESRRVAFEEMQCRARHFCRDTGFPLIVGDTNFDRDCLEHLRFDGSTTYGVLFCVLSLQRLFSGYHLASTYDMSTFWIDRGKWCNPAHYDPLIVAAVSHKTLAVHTDGIAHNRLDKARDLVSYEPARKYLHVCWGLTPQLANCSHHCPKCMRTMLNLFACNAIDDFREVFDVEYFHAHFDQYLAEWYRSLLQGDPFAEEMRPILARRHVPLLTKLSAWRIVARKAFRKMMRLGKTGDSFSPA